MIDILVRLYDLDPIDDAMRRVKENGIEIRRPIGPEKNAIYRWIAEHFNEQWAGECETAFFHSPKTMYLAIRPGDTPEPLGFASWDATALGFFGPTGVAEEARGMGIGNALLQCCLHAMREQGYGYAIIGSASKNALDFYRKTLPVSSQFLEGSKPGVYKNMLKMVLEKPKP